MEAGAREGGASARDEEETEARLAGVSADALAAAARGGIDEEDSASDGEDDEDDSAVSDD